ncbi:TetR/AcrR family transcriptional regulator [Micromonospora sp. WMMD1102]|uniref:TetR/AcrR family transcriptional regulator n=1 Tax=Micromonospora sp. WMMD1102 TaxID=3016105 RepID=UPI002414F250|nr:TetR/AcrR family transcriptional regulator [Micromonospora sp. WMMD1102]MDG4787508.1 TetR/AcrR family transcriptional regulator [Micromonospora sp. WMMD1102]
MQLKFSLTLDHPQPGMLRPRGRAERVRTAVLAATRAELQAHGYAELTMERVAETAGVAKSTVYRGWRDTTGLLTELLRELARTEVPLPDTGSIEVDLRELAFGISHLHANPVQRSMILGVIAAAVQSPRAADALRDFFRARNDQAADSVRRAIKRGDLPANTDPAEVIRCLGAPLYYRMLVTHEPVDDLVAERAAAAALAAARAGVHRIR